VRTSRWDLEYDETSMENTIAEEKYRGMVRNGRTNTSWWRSGHGGRQPNKNSKKYCFVKPFQHLSSLDTTIYFDSLIKPVSQRRRQAIDFNASSALMSFIATENDFTPS
jgi:hypothetical protein